MRAKPARITVRVHARPHASGSAACRKCSLLLLITTLLLATVPTSWAAEADAGEQALARRAREVRQRLAELREDEGEILAAMEALDELVAIEAAAADQAERKVEDARAALAVIEQDLASTRDLLVKRQRSLEPRLVARYRLGRLGYLPVLLSAQSVPELISLRRMLSRVVQADMEAMREVRRLGEVLEEQRASLQRAREDLEDLRAGAFLRLTALQDARSEREAALEAIRADRELQERALGEVARARRAMQRRMAQMARRAGKDQGFAALRGRLPRPVPGAITTGFGVGGGGMVGQKIHRGVDIRAPRGTPVRAVAPGTVAHAGWLRGYGNLVILDHGGGYYTLMAHMERTSVSEGMEVSSGEVVGLVGDSGLFEGSHLYFEVRRGAEALDPEDWFAD